MVFLLFLRTNLKALIVVFRGQHQRAGIFLEKSDALEAFQEFNVKSGEGSPEAERDTTPAHEDTTVKGFQTGIWPPD